MWQLLLMTGCKAPELGLEPLDSSTPDTELSEKTDTGMSEEGPLAGPCPLATHVGRFSVDADQTQTIVGGAVTDGVVPLSIREEVGAVGDCVLLRQNIPFCDPPCSGGMTCDWDGQCIPYPVEQDLGAVTIEGLTEPIEMVPNPPGYSYYHLGLPHPAFAPGDTVRMETEQAAVPAFALRGYGFQPLEFDSSKAWSLVASNDLAINWTAPEQDVVSSIHLRITIDQHGITPVQLHCEFADSGEGTVPGALVQQFVDLGVTGFPSGILTRWTVDSTTVGTGCVDFTIAWNGRPEVNVEGFTPCREDEDCPSGQTCDTRMEICE